MADKGIIFSAPMVRALLDGRKTQTRRLLTAAVGTDFHRQTEERHYFGFNEVGEDGRCGVQYPRLPYAPGDRLYVREACRAEELSRPQGTRPATRRERERFKRTEVVEIDELDGADGVRFLADEAWLKIENTEEAGDRWLELFHYGQKAGGHPKGCCGKSVPSIHMPRWASRLTLTVTDVRVQRVQEISNQDAIAEGVECHPAAPDHLWKSYLPEANPAASAVQSFHGLWNSLHTASGETWEANPWVVAVSFDVRRGNIDRSDHA